MTVNAKNIMCVLMYHIKQRAQQNDMRIENIHNIYKLRINVCHTGFMNTHRNTVEFASCIGHKIYIKQLDYELEFSIV